MDKLTDTHISLAMGHIVKYDLDLSDEFYDIVIPIVREFINNFDSQHNKSLGAIVVNLGHMVI